MQIINDFIEPELQDELETLLTSSNFPYYYSAESCAPPGYKGFLSEDERLTGSVLIDSNTIESPQFSHVIYTRDGINSATYFQLLPILDKLKSIVGNNYELSRCKVNLNLIDTRFAGKHHTPHIDNGFEDQITAVYYVNDADGDTLFFDNSGQITKRITPEKGKIVWWKGKVFHAKAYSIESTARIIININLLPCGTVNGAFC